MTDEIDKINKEYQKNQIPNTHGDYSGAKNSSITHPDVDEKKRAMAEGIISELGNHTQEIDSLKEIMKTVVEQQNQLAGMINQQTQALNQLAQGATQQGATTGPAIAGQPLNMDSILALGDVAEKLVGAYKNLKGNPTGPAPLIDQDFINKRMVETFMDDLDTGKSIGDFIKNSLKKQATKTIINSSLKDIGKTYDDTQHAPK